MQAQQAQQAQEQQMQIRITVSLSALKKAVATVTRPLWLKRGVRTAQDYLPNEYVLLRVNPPTPHQPDIAQLQICAVNEEKVVFVAYVDADTLPGVTIESAGEIRVPAASFKHALKTFSSDNRFVVLQGMEGDTPYLKLTTPERDLIIPCRHLAPDTAEGEEGPNEMSDEDKQKYDPTEWYKQTTPFLWGEHAHLSRPHVSYRQHIWFTAEFFNTLLDRVFYAVSDGEDKRPILETVFFRETKGKTFELIAADGFRLAQYRADLARVSPALPWSYLPDWKPAQYALRRSGLKALKSVLKKAHGIGVYRTDDVFLFRTEEHDVLVPIEKGKYPDVDHVIPAEEAYCAHATVDRDSVLQALTPIIVKKRDTFIRIWIEHGELAIQENSNPDSDVHRIQLVGMKGEPQHICLQAGFLYDAINTITTLLAQISIIDHLTICRIASAETSPQNNHYIMPARG